MKIAEAAVARPQFTLVLFALLVALGWNSLRTIPRAEDPAFPIPIFTVVALHPGAAPADMEQLVVDPLEDRLSELDDLKELSSRAEDGVSLTVVEFEADADTARKYEEVVREVNAARADLPANLERLEVNKIETTNVAVLQLALLSETASWRELQRQAERLEERLEAVAGVKEIETWAYPEQQVRVEIDPERLAALRLPIGRVLDALRSDNAVVPGGGVDVGSRRFNVEAGGHFETLEEVRETVLAADGARITTLGDVARVAWGTAEETHRARVDGRRAVFVTLEQKPNQIVFDVRDRALVVLEEFRATLPPEIELELVFDQSIQVAHRMEGLTRDFALAIGLVLLTLLPLGLRASLIVMISIPLSLSIGIALLHASGFSINQLSIVGFVIALGLLVDDSIVVVENLTRFLRMGYSRKQAAILATRQIGIAVVGCTATLMLAFLPLLMLPGGAGQFTRSLPVAVLYTVGASLFVSLTIIPFLGSLVLQEQDEHGNRAFQLFHRAIEWLYRPLLRLALGWPRATLAGAALFFIASIALVPRIGFSLFPDADVPMFRIEVEAPDGASLDETDRAVRFAEAVLARHPAVSRVAANVGHGNPQVYYNVRPEDPKSHVGELFVQLDAYEPATTPALLDAIRRELAAYPRAKLRLERFRNGPPIDAPVEMRVFDEDLAGLRALSSKVAAVIEATPGAIYVDDPLRATKTDLAVRIDSAQAGRLGVPELEIKHAVRLAIAGLVAGSLRDTAGEEYEIRMTLPQGSRASLAALDDLSVASASGAQVPLRQLARLELEASPPEIEHHDKLRVTTVSAHVASGYNTEKVTREVMARLAALEWEPGTHWEVAGELESRQESFGGFGAALLIAAFGVLAVLVLEFRTFKSTGIVASVIPLGVAGGILALWLTGYSISFTAMIGFIALIGIEVKNSILLVDFTNLLREDGVELDEAIERAGQARFFPILLTTLTALGGLLPLALEGSPLYSPLAIVIMGGLVSSTILARLVTPVMYKLLAPEVAVKSVPETAAPLGEGFVPTRA
ncbi:MAG: efflux RND transporter permease subunit [Deltaproteobacteria bacterium]|nr:efflux RND transporter permease subunit [Deltaproteobacteria bacterium]